MNKKLLLTILPLFATSLSSCSTLTDYKENAESYVEKMEYHDDFHVLQLTDIHWSVNTYAKESKGYLAKVFKEANAKCANKLDLIEITGDTFMLANKRYVKDFISFMEEQCELYNCRYSITWGNHDREGIYNVNWINNQFKKAPHCIYLEPDNDNVYERGNFVINLMDGDVVKWQIANVDSGASLSDSPIQFFRDYDYVRNNQYDWLKLMNENANNAPVVAYYHIPQKDNPFIWDAIQNNEATYFNKYFKLESFAECGNDEVGSFFVDETINRGINLKGCFSGHAHNIDWTADYKGVTVGLGVKTGKELYFAHVDINDDDPFVQQGLASTGINESFDLIGASLVTLHNDSTLDLDHLYLNERDGEDFVKWVGYYA